MLDACWVSEKPGSQHVSEANLQPLPEILMIPIQAVKEKQWGFEEVKTWSLELIELRRFHTTHHSHLFTPPSPKMWVNALSKNDAASVNRS